MNQKSCTARRNDTDIHSGTVLPKRHSCGGLTRGLQGRSVKLRQGPAQVATLVQALILMGDWCVLATVKRNHWSENRGALSVEHGSRCRFKSRRAARA